MKNDWIWQSVPTHGVASGMNAFEGVVMEIVLTFGPLYTVYATAAEPEKGNLGIMAPLAIGFVFGANILATSPFSGGSMNPASSFGPAVVFAVPEILIGLHPDAGASYYISHLPGYLDDFSAMDAFLACYGRIGNLKKTSVLPRIGLINECFGHSTIEEIINALILVEENANSRTVILNRPRVLNALDNNMIVRLKELYRSWERDPDVSFVVLKIVSIKVDITHGPKLGLEGLAYEAFELFLDAICVGRVSSMEEQLGMLITDDFSDIRTFLAKYANYAFPSEKSVLHRLEMVNKCFGHGTVEEIVNALENETVKSNDEWCISTLKKLKEAPPLSLKISLRSIQEGRYQTLSQCLAREYRMTVKAISRQISGDFCEVLNN
ncbi:hypothetical protein GH714_009262 [Hevea brasiliensis]|uniref:3-hydroxyisobutyryl-CoA hydrolase n=1 Tax=Hevea brasiliensis TaxID=3981 RepID=A0A6A6MH36_HEVBR|nr:hypothetical protein GH714_009262 [Hevea brasiliensis]